MRRYPATALAEACAAEELLASDPTPAAARLRSELAGKQLLVRGSAGGGGLPHAGRHLHPALGPDQE
ncbi:hypothetical protein ACFWIB_28635 [Streptomyces sp. NPDC127051]|uniref:hypothetical protein n=1 Tax=Streptomyces sp. NPDC127051 TaxID=3347119 RepID=UPI00365C7CC8